MGPTWAHSANLRGDRHLLADHLRGTANLARRFGTEIGAPDLSYAAGFLHDAGKITGPWQQYLLASEAGGSPAKIDHKTTGAALLLPRAGRPGWLVCQGHHGGIPNWTSLTPKQTSVDPALRESILQIVPELGELLSGPPVVPPRWMDLLNSDPLTSEMAIRMVHSTLVDADFLDTAAHFNSTEPTLRPDTDFGVLNARFTEHLTALLSGRTPSPVDDLRANLLDECLTAASGPRGIYRLPAPTGSGKTISGAAFALAHAAKHGMRRVVVAVPFLTITEQNAAVYRRLVGEEHVIEHHSGVGQEAQGAWRTKYGVENWDAPFVVTTTVQLFESLFSNRPSQTRKLHRLANAVIILDEIQAIPRHVLPVILDGLRILHELFGATIILSSATQPTWHLLGPWREAARLEVQDIVADPPRLYAGLRRSEVEWRKAQSLEDVAASIASERQALAVVNTIANARDLFTLVHDCEPEGTFHLSTRMYPAHRRSTLDEVRHRLDLGLPVRLIATQLVEAGVDLDFPTVFRAMAPAENLSQARGRCNREGRLASGRFVVMSCPELNELERSYATGIAKTRQHFQSPGTDVDDPVTMAAYYRDLFGTLAIEEQANPREIQNGRATLQYKDVADKFRMIEDDTVPVVVGVVPEAAVILEELSVLMKQRGVPSPKRFRLLQDYTVNLRRHTAEGDARVFEEISGVRVWRGTYDDHTGVRIESGTPNDSVW